MWYTQSSDKRLHAIHEIEKELKGGSDRAIGIMAGSMVESFLIGFLKNRTVKDKKLFDKITKPSGPAGAFSVKIDIAYIFNLISKDAQKDLQIIKEIRNKCAHVLDDVSFNEGYLYENTRKLHLVGRYICNTSSGFYRMSTGSEIRFQTGSANAVHEINHDMRQRFIWATRVFCLAFSDLIPPDGKPII